MPERVHIGTLKGLAGITVREIAGRRIAVFRCDGQLVAIEDRCPHQDTALSAGRLEGREIVCPKHAWRFDLLTGRRAGLAVPNREAALQRYEVFTSGDDVFVELPESEPLAHPGNGIFEYVVRYGAMGWIGRFGSIERIDAEHGDWLVVHTARGLELAELLSGPHEPATSGNGRERKPAGEVIRRASESDTASARRLRDLPSHFLPQAQQQADADRLEIDFIDGERLLDEQTVVLYYLGESTGTFDRVREALEEAWGLRVVLESASGETPVPAPRGCGNGGCGGCCESNSADGVEPAV